MLPSGAKGRFVPSLSADWRAGLSEESNTRCSFVTQTKTRTAQCYLYLSTLKRNNKESLY